MADRRMFTKKITDDDRFMSLPSSAQALYLHLSMSADDDGFSNQIATSMFKAHASTADLEMLLERKYLYQFDDGVIVIKHWRMANALRKDRYTKTAFQEDLAKLSLDENNAYTMSDGDGCRLVADRLPNGCHMVAKRLPQDRLGKDSIDNKEILNKDISHLDDDGIEEVVNAFKEICVSLPVPKVISDARKKNIRGKLKKYGFDTLKLAFQKMEASDFLSGRDGAWSGCSFDWIIKYEGNIIKVLEGNYDNKNSAETKAISDMRKITEGMTQEEYEDMERKFR